MKNFIKEEMSDFLKKKIQKRIDKIVTPKIKKINSFIEVGDLIEVEQDDTIHKVRVDKFEVIPNHRIKKVKQSLTFDNMLQPITTS